MWGRFQHRVPERAGTHTAKQTASAGGRRRDRRGADGSRLVVVVVCMRVVVMVVVMMMGHGCLGEAGNRLARHGGGDQCACRDVRGRHSRGPGPAGPADETAGSSPCLRYRHHHGVRVIHGDRHVVAWQAVVVERGRTRASRRARHAAAALLSVLVIKRQQRTSRSLHAALRDGRDAAVSNTRSA